MAPTIHLVRHAQGYHNLNVANHAMLDPRLTEFGVQQCELLSKKFPDMDKIDLIVASPLKRTIHTALLSFAPVIAKKGLTVITLPELQETSDLPCDTGSDLHTLQREFVGKKIDFSRVPPFWNLKSGRYAANRDAIEGRAKYARKWLMGRPEKNIAVVTHGGFLHYFTNDWVGNQKFSGTGWANTEFRSYDFDNTEEAGLMETQKSRKRRRGTEKPLTEAEQRNLKRAAEAQWDQEGFTKDSDKAKAERGSTNKMNASPPTPPNGVLKIQSKRNNFLRDRDWIGGFGNL